MLPSPHGCHNEGYRSEQSYEYVDSKEAAEQVWHAGSFSQAALSASQPAEGSDDCELLLLLLLLEIPLKSCSTLTHSNKLHPLVDLVLPAGYMLVLGDVVVTLCFAEGCLQLERPICSTIKQRCVGSEQERQKERDG